MPEISYYLVQVDNGDFGILPRKDAITQEKIIMMIKGKLIRSGEKPGKSPLKKYKDNPEDMNCALRAALYCSIRDGIDYAVFPGNSYMIFCWRIKKPCDVSKTECNGLIIQGFITTPTGDIFQGIEPKEELSPQQNSSNKSRRSPRH